MGGTQAHQHYTHESFPSPMASKLFPLRVRRSSNTCTSSSFINFSDGGGDPSTQPFQPFRAAGRFLRRRGGSGNSEPRRWDSSKSESSSGVCGRLDDVCEVLDEMEGPGVVGGDEGIGGGVTETERCVVARRKTGREPQPEDEGVSKRKSLGCKVVSAREGTIARWASDSPITDSSWADLTLFLRLSRAFLSLRLSRFMSSADSTTV